MATLTTARDDVTRAVANLRSLGCRVYAIIGHDTASGRYYYGIRVPGGIHPAVVGRSLSLAQQARMFTASIRQHQHDDEVVIVQCEAPRLVGERATLQRRIEAAEAVACALNHVAHRIEAFDREGSASRQHRIDTGWYLTREPGYALSIEPEPETVADLVDRLETLRDMATDDDVTPEDIVQYVRENF